MKELIKLRKRREKHFLNSDGTITAYMYNHDVHCKKNGKWEEKFSLNQKNDFCICLK